MKKKHLKALKILSERLPVSYDYRKHSKYSFQGDLKGSQKAKYDGIFEDNEVMRIKGYQLFKINHYKKLKSAYRNKAEQGIIDYINWLKEHNKFLSEKFEELDIQEINQNILDIVKKGASNFWANLIAFIYSFIKIFQNESKEIND